MLVMSVAVMSYSTALHFFAFMLALIGTGLMAIMAHFANASSAVAPDPTTMSASTPHMPARVPARSRTVLRRLVRRARRLM